jgi:hypothetical protein
MRLRTRLLLSFILLIIISFHQLEAQILRDTTSLRLVRQAIGSIYSMKFNDAGIITSKINEKYPDHPVVMLLQGMTIYWKNFPLTEKSQAREGFEELLHNCIRKCENYAPEDEAEFLLATLCARGMLLLFYADNQLNSKLYPLARNSYKYLKRSFDFTGSFPDFYFFTGLYRYYREVYPEVHPIYKPLLVLFPRGDKVKGMTELQIASEKAIFMKSEASDFLSSNYKYYENNFSKASHFSKILFEKYPANLEYRSDCIENLLLDRKYDEAEKLINTADPGNYKYFSAQLKIFRGVLDEKKHHDIGKATQEYTEGANEISLFGDYGTQYMAYAYFGLSRISQLNNDAKNQKLYRKKALELTDFRNINFD